MQKLFAIVVVFLVLNCLSVQIAEPLATSYAADVSQQHDASMEFNENEENLVQQQQHHVRHKGAHMHRTTAHHSRHRQQQHADGVKSESVAMASEITTPAAADATESLNFQHKHKQQQQQQHKVSYDMQLELDKQKKLQQQLQQKHAHAQHKNALKSRTSITTVMDNGSETVELAGVDELVKPTWPPTYSNNNERTITVDEANKGNTQNYYQQQAIIRQQQQQQQQQHHHKHHKLQPAADLSRTKATTMTSVVHLMHHNKVVHASSQINVDTDNADDDDDAASSTVLHAHTHSTVDGGGGGGIKAHKAAVSTTTDDGLTTENTRNDKSVDYVDDDDVEYYDYNADDEPNEPQHATQSQLQPLAMADIGGYTYDSGIDDGIDGGDVEWRPVQQHHQQLRHNQEQWHAQQMQLHRRQHWQREEHQQQQQYESEHARVARDHHRVQASELRNNRLPFDTMDDYLNDEPALKPEEINDIKQKTLGTPDTVRNEFNSYVQNQRMRYLAAAHYEQMKSATKCERPMPHVIPASNYTSKTYYPTHTILYRCGEYTGCCRSKGQICTVEEYENVTLYFYVDSSNSRQHIEGLTMRNHTKCSCQNRPSETQTTPEYVARGKRSDLAYRRHTRSHHAALDAENQLEESSDLAYGSEKRQAAICRCPIHFDVFQEDIRAVATQRHQHDEVQSQSNVARTYNCRCDCEDDNASCQRFKNGDEGFGMDDRRCIAQRICSIPNCSFGIYNEQIGRCPRSNRKHKRHNIGFG